MAEEMMIYIPMRYRVDLDKTINTTPLNTLFAMGDNQAHRFELTITHGSVAENLTGCEVKGKFVSFSNNMTVILTGSVENGNAVVTLKQPCYTQLGRFALVIQIVKDGMKTSVFYGDGYMRNTSTDNAIIDEDYIVYDTDVLLSKIQEIENAISGANAAISNANAAAEHVDANMDAKITARVDKTLSVENGIADAKTVGDEIGSLKSDKVDKGFKKLNKDSILILGVGRIWSTTGLFQIYDGSLSTCVEINIPPNTYEKIEFTSTDTDNFNASGIAFYDNSMNFISGISYYKNPGEKVYDIPENTSVIRLEIRTDSIDDETYTTFTFSSVNNTLYGLKKEFDENNANLENYKLSLGKIVTDNKRISNLCIDKLFVKEEKNNCQTAYDLITASYGWDTIANANEGWQQNSTFYINDNFKFARNFTVNIFGIFDSGLTIAKCMDVDGINTVMDTIKEYTLEELNAVKDRNRFTIEFDCEFDYGEYFAIITEATTGILLAKESVGLKAYPCSDGTNKYPSISVIYDYPSSVSVSEINSEKLNDIDKSLENINKNVFVPIYDDLKNQYAGFVGRWFEKTVNGKKCMVATNCGAEIWLRVSGTTQITVEWEQMVSTHTPYFAYSIDGKPATRQISTNGRISLPDTDEHFVRIITDGIYENVGKWNGNGFAFYRIYADNAICVALEPKCPIIAFFGDSITEGIRALGVEESTSVMDEVNSATNAFPWFACEELSAVSYRVGYGASGAIADGSFKNFETAIDFMTSDIDTRVGKGYYNESTPNLIVVNHGTNDANEDSDTFKQAYQSAIYRLKSKYPQTHILCMRPFGGYQEHAIMEVAENTSGCTYVDTTGWDIELTDTYHPTTNGAKAAGLKLAEFIRVNGIRL